MSDTKEDKKKELAGRRALNYVEDGQVIGLGTGSTAKHFIMGLKNIDKDVKAVPTSTMSHNLARELDIPIITDPNNIDLAVDGADQVDPNKNLIKGRGGAMVQEKLIDYGADKFIVVVDDSKLVGELGGDDPVPVEVIPRSWRSVKNKLETLREADCELRMAEKKDGPVVTDNGNFILDTFFRSISDIEDLESRINNIPGVLDNGLFSRECEVIVGKDNYVEII